MSSFIAWCGFAGAWLLFAGPVYQASLELREQDIERDRIAATKEAVPRPSNVSAWWWLLPPVHYLLWRRRSHEYRTAVMRALDPHDREDLVQYMSKALGWLLVGAGGLLIAVKETWELHEHYEWPLAVFWILTVAMALVSASYSAASQARSRQLMAPDALDRA